MIQFILRMVYSVIPSFQSYPAMVALKIRDISFCFCFSINLDFLIFFKIETLFPLIYELVRFFFAIV
jgi:hypothetical protein